MLSDLWPHATLAALLDLTVIVVCVPWVLLTKREATSAVAWCLVVVFMPFVGALLYWMFGYNYMHRRVRRVGQHRARLGQTDPLRPHDGEPDVPLSLLARRARAFPAAGGNAVTLFHDTQKAYDALLDAVREARHHVHLEFFILRGDAAGRRLLGLLAQKAKEGVEVRLLYDAVGSLHLPRRALVPLAEAGGRASAYLPINPLRSRVQFNLRNHRKIVVIDGRVGFTGGMNVGDEYLGKSRYFGYWRDGFLRVEGPAVNGLQLVFRADWDFTRGELLRGEAYFPKMPAEGGSVVQVAESGPDQDVNCMREIFFMAISGARRRLWIASPYCVPDDGLRDALRLACYRGVDVRLLTLFKPDHYLSFYAGRYYNRELLETGVKVYLYTKGMMHNKLLLADDEVAVVGSANLDNRSLKLNFEAGCLLYDAALVEELAEAYLRDLDESQMLDANAVARRSLPDRIVENACRLLAPAL